MWPFVLNVTAGLFTAFLILIIKWQWPFIQSLFDAESRRQARQISGIWTAQEIFADGTQDEFLLEIHCVGGRVTGTHRCLAGFDHKKEFPFVGTYKDHVLALTWMPKDHALLESGTVAGRLLRDGELEGHGLYVEPVDGKIYVSTYKARKDNA